MKQEIKRWLDKAKDDLRKAKDNFKIKNYDLTSFLCQQAIEKAFKALLIKKTNKFPKIHDLVRLGKLVDLPQNLIEYCKDLTLSYIYSRYPDIKEPKNMKEISNKFLKHTEEILKWIKKNL